MVYAVFWPDEEARTDDGTVVLVTVVVWDYEARQGKAKRTDGSWVDVFLTTYADADLTIGVPRSVSLEQ